MFKIGIIFALLQLLKSQPTDEYEYKYDDDDGQTAGNEGTRLVGAKAASTYEYPFLVGWNSFGMDDTFSCTGSLITSRYFISAAHCNNLINQKSDREYTREKCAEDTKARGSYSGKYSFRMQIMCKFLPSGDFEIRTEPKGKAWMGIDNLHANRESNSQYSSEIKRHIRHKYSYKGGGTYGKYGGYDITLIEVETPFTQYKPACLPAFEFDDIRETTKDTKLAGYGKFLREGGQVCETNRFGLMKYHYCDESEGYGNRGCITDRPPKMREECKDFFADANTPDTVPSHVEEIKIIGGGKHNILCYPDKNPEDASFGWCRTRGHYYDKDNPDKEWDRGWGFCSKDCYLDPNSPDNGVLRSQKNVGVLPEKECLEFVRLSFWEGDVKHVPQILCVAKREQWREEQWERQDGGGYKKVEHQETNSSRYGMLNYAASIGTCQGDSGGPAFVEEGSNFILTGVVSGGRGELGNCGGVNNPVHYVRVKKLTKWISINLGKEKRNLCWNEDFQRKLDRKREESRSKYD